MAFYLRRENGRIEFLTDEIHNIKENDILLTNEEYNEFFELQSQGFQYKLKTNIPFDNFNNRLFDNVEEFALNEVPIEKTEIQIRIENLTNENKALKKDIQSIKEILKI